MKGRWLSLKKGPLAVPRLQEGWSSGRLLSGYRRVKDEVSDPSKAPASASKDFPVTPMRRALFAGWLVSRGLLSLQQGHREKQSGDGRWQVLYLPALSKSRICWRANVCMCSPSQEGRLPEGESGDRPCRCFTSQPKSDKRPPYLPHGVDPWAKTNGPVADDAKAPASQG